MVDEDEDSGKRRQRQTPCNSIIERSGYRRRHPGTTRNPSKAQTPYYRSYIMSPSGGCNLASSLSSYWPAGLVYNQYYRYRRLEPETESIRKRKRHHRKNSIIIIFVLIIIYRLKYFPMSVNRLSILVMPSTKSTHLGCGPISDRYANLPTFTTMHIGPRVK